MNDWENLGALLSALEDSEPEALGGIDDGGLLDELVDVQKLIKQSDFPDLNSVKMTGPAKKIKPGDDGPGIFRTGPAFKTVDCPHCGKTFTV